MGRLKACPFCGDTLEPMHSAFVEHWGATNGDNSGYSFCAVGCDRRGFSTADPACNAKSGYAATRSEATKKWNRRTEPQSFASSPQGLTPCPFCGHEAAPTCMFVKDISPPLSPSPSCASRRVVCCDMSRGGCGATGGDADTPEAAIANWNRRTRHRSR